MLQNKLVDFESTNNFKTLLFIIEEKCKAYFENIEHRIIKIEENQI